MRRTSSVCFVLGIVIGLLCGAMPAVVCGAEEENAQAVKYHALLRQRPEPGYLFDRFYNAWLDQATVESLQTFLQKQVEQSGTTADRLLLAFFHAKQNNDVAAIDQYAQALKTDSSNPAAWFYKAQAELRTLDFDAAIADLKEAGRQKPDEKLSLSIERQLGTALLRNHQTEEAVAVWKALLAAHPDDEELCEDIIELHIEEGLFDQAAALSKGLIERTKDPSAAVMRRLRLGDIYHRAAERRKALDIYASSLQEAGDGSWLEREILAQIEQLFRREDDLKGLKEQYAELLKTYPKRIGLLLRRCRLLVELGENDEAVEGYRAILELTPGDRANREEYVDVLSRLGRHEMAVKELRALCKQNADDAELQVRLAKTLHEAKQPAEAAKAVERYLEISDKSEYAYTRAARLVEGFGDKEQAAPLFQKLAETFADSPSAQETYAAFMYAKGDKDKALAIWKKLALQSDLHTTINIARALESRGEDAVAFELLDSRLKDFQDEPLFLGQLAEIAQRLKKFDQSIPWAKRRVELADNAGELELAIAQAAMSCQQADRLDAMIAELEKTQNRPVSLTCLLAELLEIVGDSERADGVLREPIERGERLALDQQIRLFSLRRDWGKAAEATRRLLEQLGGRESFHVRRLVELYERDFQIDEALKWVETWKRVSPGGVTPWLTEARLLTIQGKDDDAQNALRKAIQRFEDDEDLHVQLAQTYQQAGKIRDAERVYWRLYEKTEELGAKLRWVSELAKLAEREGTLPRLVEDFQQRRRNNRQSLVPLLALAEIHRVGNNYEERRQALLAATKIKPDDLQMLAQIARLEELEGHWKDAMATLQRAAKLDKTPQTRQNIARLLIEYGNADEGFAMLRDLMGEGIADPRDIERMANSLCGMSEWERAADLLRPRIAEHPDDWPLRYIYAVACEESGRTREAVDQFLQLLDLRESTNDVKKKMPTATNPSHNYVDMLRSLLPPEAYELFESSQNRYSVYSYRQNRQAGVRYASPVGYAIQSAVSLPSCREMVRSYAMIHLQTLSQELDEPQQNDLIAKLKNLGVRNPKLIFKMGVNPHGGFPPVAEALEESPDDEALLAMAILSGFNPERPLDAEHLARAFKKFRATRPELALMAAVQAAAKEAKYAPLFDEAATAAQGIKRPNPLMIMSLAATIGGLPFRPNQGETAFTQEQKAKLIRLLVDWYPRLAKGNTPYGPYAFFCIVSSLRSSEDPSAYFALLENEVSQYRTDGGSSPGSSLAMMFGGRPNAAILEPLGFPPRQLSDFPPNVFDLLSPNAGSSISRQFTAFGDAQPWTPEQVAPLVKKVKDPILRALLAQQNELGEVVESAIKELLAQKPPSLDAYLMAAGKAESESQFDKAVELLEKARHLPMKPEMRQTINSAIVAAVLAAKDKGAIDDELAQAGRDAALRLRRQRLDQQQRDQLVAAMESLGLKKEAEKLEKRAEIAASSPMPSYSAVGLGVPATPEDRVEKLLASGNRDTAVRLLLNEVRSLGQQMRANPYNIAYYRYQARELGKRIEKHGMTDDVMKQFEPGESDNVAKLSEYAMACELFDRKDEARKAYQSVLDKRPKEDTARMRLLMLVEGDSAAIDEHLEKLSDAASSNFGQMLAGGVNDHEAVWDERFRCVEIGMRYLGKMKDRPKADVEWATQLIQAFAGSQYSNRTNNMLPPLYVRRDAERYGNNVDRENMKRKEKLHREFCLQMIEVPNLGRSGFQHLLAAAEARGDVLQQPGKDTSEGEKTKDDPPRETAEDFRQIAEKVLLNQAERRAQRGPHQTVYYSSGESDQVRFRSPEEYLVVTAWKSGDWKPIDEVLLPKLEGGRNKDARRAFEVLSKLYRCSDDEFLAAAGDVVKHYAPAVQGMPTTDDGLSIVVDAWAERSSKADLCPMVIDAMRRSIASPYSSIPPAALGRYLENLVRQGKSDDAQVAFERLTALYLGPAEKRVDYIKKNYQPNNMAWGSANQKIQSYFNLLNQLAQRDSLFFLVLAQAEPLGDVLPRNNLTHQVRQCVERAMKRKLEDVMAILGSSPWLADFDRFRVFPLGNQVEEWPLAQVFRNNELMTDGRFKPLWDGLEQQQNASPTFGRGLWLAVHAQRTEKTALLDFMAKNMDGLNAMPEKEQTALAALLREIVRKDALEGLAAGTPQQAAQQWIESHGSSRSQEMLDKLQKAKRIEDIGFRADNFWEVSRYVGEILPGLVRDDPQQAKKVFFRIVDLMEDAQKKGQMHHYFSGGQTLAGTMLEQALQQHHNEMKPEMILFLIDVFSSPESDRVSQNQWLQYWFQQRLQQSFEKAHQGPDGKRLTSQEAAERFYEELGKMLDGRPGTLLIPGIADMIRQYIHNEKDCQWLVEWTKQKMQDGKYPELAADLFLCARSVQEERFGRKEPNPDVTLRARREPADYDEVLRKRIDDANSAMALRLTAAQFVGDRSSAWEIPLATARDAAAVYVDAIEKGAPVVSHQHESLLYVLLSLRGDEESKALLDRWREQFAARYLRATPTTGKTRNFSVSPDNPTVVSQALHLYLSFDDMERVGQLLNKYDSILSQSPMAIAQLVRYGKSDMAAAQFRAHWTTIKCNWPDSVTNRYNGEVQKNAAAFLEKLSKDEEKLLAEVMLATMPDSPSPDKEAPPREDRLAALAQRLKTMEIGNRTVKNRTILGLITGEKASEIIADEIAAEYANIQIEKITEGHNFEQMEDARPLVHRHVENRLKANDVGPMVDCIEKLSKVGNNAEYMFDRLGAPMLKSCFDSLLRENVRWTDPESKQMAAALRTVTKDKRYVSVGDCRIYTSLLFLSHIQSKEIDSFAVWHKELSENMRSQLFGNSIHQDFWKRLVKTAGPSDTDNLPRRIESMQGLFSLLMEIHSFFWNPHHRNALPNDGQPIVQRIIDGGLITPEELVEHGPGMAEKIDDAGLVKAALAAWLSEKNEHAKASAAWQTAIATAPKDSQQLHYWRWELARSLVALNQQDEAIKSIEQVDENKLEQQHRAGFQKFRAELKPSDSPAPEKAK